jgi:hypothetical protein
MRPTVHAVISLALVGLAAGVAVPALLAAGSERSITSTQLSVPSERARPALFTANSAMGPLVQVHAGLPQGNPFALRERGQIASLPVPEPPPPPLTLPDPPPTPFAPTAR